MYVHIYACIAEAHMISFVVMYAPTYEDTQVYI